MFTSDEVDLMVFGLMGQMEDNKFLSKEQQEHNAQLWAIINKLWDMPQKWN